MAENRCAECDKEIVGEALWFNPFLERKRVGPETVDLYGSVTYGETSQDAGAAPYHQECFHAKFKDAKESK